MAARSRPRGGQLKDEIDEERSIWSQIREDAKRLDILLFKSNEVSKKIVELSEQQAGLKVPSSSIDAELDNLLRENIRVLDELESGWPEMDSKLEILAALRDSHEAEPNSASRAASVGKSQRERQTKRKLTDAMDDRDSVAAESPGGQSSPKVVVGGPKDRLKAMSGGSRAGSVPAGRESSVKDDDTPDSLDQIKEKHRLAVHTEVLYRNNKSRSLEGEGILCRVTSVIGEGKQRRYEIIDADPDPPVPAQPYRASVNHLVAIPPLPSNGTLPDLKVGRQVLALYPGTTTFYKAEVVAAWSGKREIKDEGKDDPTNFVRLRFEGEDEADREMSVERRYVLPDR